MDGKVASAECEVSVEYAVVGEDCYRSQRIEVQSDGESRWFISLCVVLW